MEREEFERLFELLDEQGKIAVNELIEKLWFEQQINGVTAEM